MSQGVRSVLMVCAGNICRSPTAEVVLREKLRAAGLGEFIHVDSAGIHDMHTGDSPDPRSQSHAAIRGYDLSAVRARAVHALEFERFDLILAMDWKNLERLRARCPAPYASRLNRLMAYASPDLGDEIPDPYSGGHADFEHVLDLVESACDGLVRELSAGAS